MPEILFYVFLFVSYQIIIHILIILQYDIMIRINELIELSILMGLYISYEKNTDIFNISNNHFIVLI